MGNHRKASALEQAPWRPGSNNVGKFGRKMRDWWSSLQPDSRGGDWPLARTVAEDESWPELRKGGSTGFVLMVIGLSWWVRLAESSKDKNESASMLEDVVFVLGKILKGMDSPGDGAQPKRKRSVTFSSLWDKTTQK